MSLLEDEVAIVTGAAGGIGRATASLLAKHGAKLVLLDSGASTDGTGSEPSRVNVVARELEDAGAEVVALAESVATGAGAQRAVDTALQDFGRLDILINCAGIKRDRPLLRMTEDEFDAVLDVHAKGTFLCMRAAADVMKRQGHGCIVNTTSKAGLTGNFGQGNVSAADAAVHGLTLTASIEWQRHGIRVNAVAPIAKTRLTEDLPMFEHVDSMRPEHVAPAYVFLASSLSGQTTASVIGVAGSRMSAYRLVESAGQFKDEGAGLWTPEELAEHFVSVRKI
jgi:NAD(P)-dependent dehydrogenase (short-subunit alcohol dehydrogenase family)